VAEFAEVDAGIVAAGHQVAAGVVFAGEAEHTSARRCARVSSSFESRSASQTTSLAVWYLPPSTFSFTTRPSSGVSETFIRLYLKERRGMLNGVNFFDIDGHEYLGRRCPDAVPATGRRRERSGLSRPQTSPQPRKVSESH
jgi:hypothetical protein